MHPDSLEGLLSGCSRGVVVLHLGFLQIIVSNNKDDTEVPVRFVSWFFHLERTDPIGYETWKRLRLLLFLPVGRGKRS